MLVALSIILATAVVDAPFANPTRAQLAGALEEFTGKKIPAEDVRRVSCVGFKEEPTETSCKWQQRFGGKWQQFSGYLAVDRRGWHLIDEPKREPGNVTR